MTASQTIFVDYIRTLQDFSFQLKGEYQSQKPVHVSSNFIETRFFKFQRKEKIEELVELGELEIIKKGNAFFYKALKNGLVNHNWIDLKPISSDKITSTLITHLQNTTLKEGSLSTDYFDRFLKFVHIRPDLFFIQDQFAGRIHTACVNLHRTLRPNILLYTQPTVSLDIVTAQPLILGKILFDAIGINEYSSLIFEGKDIYLLIKHKMNLKTRNEAKLQFYKIVFGWPSNALSEMFGNANWITWINEYKSKPEPRNNNPKMLDNGKISHHNNLAWLLQTTEVQIMSKIWDKLVIENIPFLTIHDEIITTVGNLKRVEIIMNEVLSKEFTFFKINSKKPIVVNIASDRLRLLHILFTQAEQDGMLTNHPDREHISNLWKGVKMYRNNPNLQELYLKGLEEIDLTKSELPKTG